MISLFFSFKGRIGRLAFFVGSIALMVVSTVVSGVLGGLYGASATAAVDPADLEAALQAQIAAAQGGAMIGGIVGLLLLWPNLALVVKRLHDLNRSAWTLLWVVLTIVGISVIAGISAVSGSAPIAGVASILGLVLMIGWTVYLLFFKGTEGRNRFGAQPSGFETGEADYDGVFA